MRSQLFGFTLPICAVYEANIECSLQQATELASLSISRLGAYSVGPGSVSVLGEIYTRKWEVWFNEVDAEMNQIIYEVLRKYALEHEMHRMKCLQNVLSWRWYKFRETAVIAHLELAQTIKDQVHLVTLVGWNKGAAEKEVRIALEFFETLSLHFQRLGIPWHWLQSTASVETAADATAPHHYGPRLDTIAKLQKVRQLREEERQRGRITSTRMIVCETVGIATSTFKKYDKMLYDRWYDVDYKGDT